MSSTMRFGYWRLLGRRRTARRRFLAGTAGVALGGLALGLSGCEGLERAKGPATPGDASGLISSPLDTTATARSGGVFKGVAGGDVPTLDPLATSSTLVHTTVAAYTYPRLMKFTPARFPDKAKGGVEGDLAEAAELSPDRLQVTLKLRQGLKWDARAPTGARVIDAQDVLFSWRKFTDFSPIRGDLAYHPQLAPWGPVEAMSAPDSRTVVVRLRQPDASLLSLLAFDRLFYVMPRESDGGFDPRFEARGYGPWLLAENRPMAFRIWTKNPDYYVKGRPFADAIDLPVIGDYTGRLAQFKAGNIWTSVASQDDILPTKRELPETLLRKSDTFATAPSTLAFGYEGDTPWRDERMRQAVSLLIDRETLTNLGANRGRFVAEGLPPREFRYHTVVGAGWEGYWLSPKDSRFGANGKYYGFDPAEARRLMNAAGHVDGVDTFLHYNGGGQYGVHYARTAELVSGMLSEGGIRARLDPREYQSDWLPNYHYAYAMAQNAGRPIKGFRGIAYRPTAPYPTPDSQLFSTMHRDGIRFEGMTPDGRNPHMGDAEVNQALVNIRREFDDKRRQELVQDFARMMAKKAYTIPHPPSSAATYSLSWPVIGNLGLFRTWPGGNAVTEANIHLWIDASQPPLRPA